MLEQTEQTTKRSLKLIWKQIKRRTSSWTVRITGLICALLLMADLWCEFHGMPKFALNYMTDKLSTETLKISAGWMRAGIFRGITAEQVTISQDHGDFSTIFLAEEINFKLKSFSLITRNYNIDTFKIVGGFFNIIGKENAGLGTISDINISCRVTGDNQLLGQSHMTCHGVSFSTQIAIKNSDNLDDLFKSFSKKSADSNPWELDEIDSFSKFLNRIDCGNRDSYISSTLYGSATNLDSINLVGNFVINQATIFDCFFNKLRGGFKLNMDNILLENIQLIISDDENIHGNAKIDLNELKLKASIYGDIIPNTMLRMMRQTRQLLPQFIEIDTPVSFKTTLSSDYLLQIPNMECHAVCPKMEIYNVPILDNNIDISFKDNVLKLDKAVFNSKLNKNKVVATGQWNVKDNLVSGQIDSTINICHILQDMGVMSYSSTALDDFNNTKFSLRVEPSAPSIEGLKGSIELSEAAYRCSLCDLSNIHCAIKLADGIVNIEDISAEFSASEDNPKIAANGQLNLAKLMQEHKVSSPINLYVGSNKTGKTLDFTSEMNLNIDLKTLSFDKCHLQLFLDENHKLICKSVHLPDGALEILDLLHNGGQAMTSDFTVNINSLEYLGKSWEITGVANAPDGSSFNNLGFNYLTTQFTLSPTAFICHNIDSKIVNGGKLTIDDLDFNFQDESVEMTNIYIEGSPMVISAFILDKADANFYNSIWDGTVWPTDPYPHIVAGHFYFKNDNISYKLVSSPVLSGQNIVYNSFQIPYMEATINLNLPERIDINPIKIKNNNNVILSDTTLLFGQPYICEFNIRNDRNSQLDIIQLLKAINSDWEGFLNEIQVSDDVSTNIHGLFNFDNNISYYKVTGENQANTIIAKENVFNNADIFWVIDSNDLNINIKNANYMDGNLHATVAYNYNSSSGNALINVENIPAKTVMNNLKEMIAESDHSKKPEGKPVSAENEEENNNSINLGAPFTEEDIEILNANDEKEADQDKVAETETNKESEDKDKVVAETEAKKEDAADTEKKTAEVAQIETTSENKDEKSVAEAQNITDNEDKTLSDSKNLVDAIKGQFSATCHLNFYKNWGGYPLYLEGNGHLKLSDADLWRMPLMRKLGDVVASWSFNLFSSDRISRLGTISTLDADFEFHGRRLAVPNIKTDGTLIALKGSGNYDFDSNQLHFIVESQLMKKINFVSLILSPLNWIFDAELTGTPQNCKWKRRSLMSKLFYNE